MRNFLLYKDMFDGTKNHNVYSKKVEKYINEVKDEIPPELLNILNSYKLNLGDFSMKFFDFEKEKFKDEEFNHHIEKFCAYIEAIQLMNSANNKENTEKA